VLLDTVVEELGYAPHVVKRAFDILESQDVGEQLDTDHGLVFSFDLV